MNKTIPTDKVLELKKKKKKWKGNNYLQLWSVLF